MTAATLQSNPATPAQPRLLTVRPAPRREPPFDDELPADHIGVGRHDRPLPFDDLVRPLQAMDIRTVTDPDLPDPARWARSLLVGIIETANGHRPPQQLATLFSVVVAMRISADLAAATRNRRPHWLHAASIRSVRAMQPCPGVAEVSATLGVGHRVRAVAMRVERRHGKWRCTRLQLG